MLDLLDKKPKTSYWGRDRQCASAMRCSSTTAIVADVIAAGFHSSRVVADAARSISGVMRRRRGVSGSRPAGNELRRAANEPRRSGSCAKVGTWGADAPAPRMKQARSVPSASIKRSKGLTDKTSARSFGGYVRGMGLRRSFSNSLTRRPICSRYSRRRSQYGTAADSLSSCTTTSLVRRNL